MNTIIKGGKIQLNDGPLADKADAMFKQLKPNRQKIIKIITDINRIGLKSPSDREFKIAAGKLDQGLKAFDAAMESLLSDIKNLEKAGR